MAFTFSFGRCLEKPEAKLKHYRGGKLMALQIRYLGWTAFEITTQEGTRVLLDPMLAGDPGGARQQ